MGTLTGHWAKSVAKVCQHKGCGFIFLFLGTVISLLLIPTPAWPQQNGSPGILPRAGINIQLPPAGSLRLDRGLAAWQDHRWWILGALAVVGAQVGLISFLAMVQFRKSRAQRELVKQIE